MTLHHLTWANYQEVLQALPQTRAAHLVYGRGTLEISMPLEDHEQASELIGLFIRILAMEMGLKTPSPTGCSPSTNKFGEIDKTSTSVWT